MSVHSAIYEGWVGHRRHDPVAHSFGYPVFVAYLDLAELPEVLDPLRGWSARARPALAWFRRSDHLGPSGASLDSAVRDQVAATTGSRPAGPIRLLTNLRYFGHCFNPVSFYFCFDRAGAGVDAVLAEVHNTPWGESHAYVIGAEGPEGSIRGRVEKRFHVSPLMSMDHVYEWRTTPPGERLEVSIASHSGGECVFDARLALARRELTPATARTVLARYPAITMQTLARIYWQALRLRLKGVPWHPHPTR
jgi:DUF1365 family protein